MNILITGNMGYVGPRVVRHLRRRFAEGVLRGLDAGWFGSQLTNASVLPESLLDEQIFCDVRDASDDMLRGADAVVHLAGVSNDPIGKQYESVTLEINTEASHRLAARAKACGVRSFVFASSCSVYGQSGPEARTEDSEVRPLTAYATSKIRTEAALRSLASPDFRVTCLRFSTACGMSERLRLDLVLNDFVAGAVATGRITILSDGTPWRPLIDVNDMALAVEWAVTREGSDYVVVNVGRNDANYSVLQLAQAVAAVLPGTEISVNPDAQPDSRSYKVDFSMFARLAPSHQPRVRLEQSIAELRTGLHAIGYSSREVQQSPLIRLRTLSALQASGQLTSELRWRRACEEAPVQ